MANSNQTLKWINSLEDNKIIFDAGIIDGSKNRGIYGIFAIDIIKGCLLYTSDAADDTCVV